jgi:hypothetical protein
LVGVSASTTSSYLEPFHVRVVATCAIQLAAWKCSNINNRDIAAVHVVNIMILMVILSIAWSTASHSVL